MSGLTGRTDFRTETAIVEQAERRNVFASVMGQDRVSGREFGFLSTGERLRFDFGSKFGLGWASQAVFSKQLKEYRAKDNPGKAYGKVFAKGQPTNFWNSVQVAPYSR